MKNEEAVTRADIEFHAATAHVYEETLDPLFRAYDAVVTEPLLDSLPRRAPGREALDVGCGTGVLTLRLAERGFRVEGIDHSEAMLELARQKVRERGCSGAVNLRTGDVRELPYEDASFDLVTCTGVLHHLADIRRCVVEADRVLRPGGVLFVAEPCTGSNPSIRAWDRLMRLRARVAERRSPAAAAEPAPAAAGEPLEVPDHDEGPIDVDVLTGTLAELGMDVDLTYWSFFDGLYRLGPLWLQKAVVVAGSRPWRRRSGNMFVLLGRAR